MISLSKKFHHLIGLVMMVLSLGFIALFLTAVLELQKIAAYEWEYLLMPLLILLIGGMNLWSSYGIYRDPSLENIKWSIGPLSMIAATYIVKFFDGLFFAEAESSLGIPFSFSGWFILGLGLLIYAWVSRMIIKKHFQQKIHSSYLFGRTTAFVIALGVFACFPGKYPNDGHIIYQILAPLAMILIPIAAYKGLVEWIFKMRDRHPLDYSTIKGVS